MPQQTFVESLLHRSQPGRIVSGCVKVILVHRGGLQDMVTAVVQSQQGGKPGRTQKDVSCWAHHPAGNHTPQVAFCDLVLHKVEF